MNKLIIDNQTELSDLEVLFYIGQVIEKGLISETSRGKQYCFVTSFVNGVTVGCFKNKKSSRFVVYTETRREQA